MRWCIAIIRGVLRWCHLLVYRGRRYIRDKDDLSTQRYFRCTFFTEFPAYGSRYEGAVSDSKDRTLKIAELQRRVRELEAAGKDSSTLLENLSSHQEELRLQNEQLLETQSELDLSRLRYARLFDFLPIGVLLVDRDGVVQEVNRAVLELTGRERDRVVGRPILPLFHQGEYQHLSERLAAAVAGHESDLVTRLSVRGGGTIDAELRFVPTDFGGDTPRIYITVVDTREKQRVMDELAESERRFRNVIEHTPYGLCITREDNTFEYVNDAYCHLYGYERDELIGQPFTVVVPERFRTELERAHRAFLEEREEFAGTYNVVRKDGEEITIEAAAAWYLGSDGRPRKATFVLDVTRRIEREAKLRRFRHALDAAKDAVYLVDYDAMRFIEVNRTATTTLGYTRDELLRMGPADIDRQKTRDDIKRSFEKMFHSTESFPPFRTLHQRKDGTIIPVEMQTGFLVEGDRKIIIGIGRDISQQLHTESELRRVNRELDQLLKAKTSSLASAYRELQLMNTVMDNSLNGVVITDENGVIQQVNSAFTTVTGYSREDALGKTPQILKSGRHEPTFYQTLWAKLQNTGQWQGEIWNRRKTGEVYPEWLTIRGIYDELGGLTNYIAIFHDLTELRAKEQEVDFQTNFDALTKLPNRPSFLDRVDSSIRNARRTQTSVAVAIADIDDFRKVNETAGHTTGDAFLENLAGRLKEAVGPDATLARIGGDEFGVLIEGISDQWDYVETTDRIASICGNPLDVDGASYTVTLSLGVALFPDDGGDAETLLNNAEAALYQVKERPILPDRGRVGMFTAALDEALRRRITLESQMRKDLERGAFRPFYQPRVNLATGEIVGAEALARWIRDDGSVVSPVEFIPLAEETGLITRIGEKMIEAIRSDIEGPLGRFRDSLTLSFNASVKELRDPEFLNRLTRTIETSSIIEMLEIELTESVIMEEIDTTMPTLQALKDQGFSLAVDDFGTGYSSLYYLKRLPIDVLKIDKSFVDEVATDQNDQAIVRTIIAMGHALNLRLVAEGVETTAQERFLTDLDCSEAQGYLYGKPMDRDTFVTYLAERKGVAR